jgi:hypothetical protein
MEVVCWWSDKKDREFRLWQEGIGAKQILNEEMMRQKVEYIHKILLKEDMWIDLNIGDIVALEII